MTIAATDNGYCEWMMLFAQSKEEAQAAYESFLLSLTLLRRHISRIRRENRITIVKLPVNSGRVWRPSGFG